MKTVFGALIKAENAEILEKLNLSRIQVSDMFDTLRRLENEIRTLEQENIALKRENQALLEKIDSLTKKSGDDSDVKQDPVFPFITFRSDPDQIKYCANCWHKHHLKQRFNIDGFGNLKCPECGTKIVAASQKPIAYCG